MGWKAYPRIGLYDGKQEEWVGVVARVGPGGLKVEYAAPEGDGDRMGAIVGTEF